MIFKNICASKVINLCGLYREIRQSLDGKVRYIVNHARVHIICIFTVQALFKIISLKIIKDMLSPRDLGNLDYDNVKGKKFCPSP
jgi:hypothetical protein